jgi:hypothetical protein
MPLTGPSVRVLSRRVRGGATLHVTAILRREVTPVPGSPGRIDARLCLKATAAGRAADEVCQPPDRATSRLRLGGARGCAGRPTVVAGFVPAQATALIAVLGDGRSVRLATRPTPYGRPERIVAGALPPGQALRRVQAVDGSGRVLAGASALVAPPDRRCGPSSFTFTVTDFTDAALGTPAGTQVAAALPGGPRLVVREQGDLICLGLDRLALDGSDCVPVPFSRRQGLELGTIRQPSGTIVAVAALPARVATVVLKLDDKSTMRIPTVPGSEYTGVWRADVRFLLAALPSGRLADEAALEDAEGRRLDQYTIEDFEGPTERAGRTLLRAGSTRLRVDHGTFPGDTRSYPCLALVIGGRTAGSERCFGFLDEDTRLFAIASCSPRTTILFAAVTRRVRRIDVRLTSGRVLHPRLVAIPGTQARTFLVRTAASVSQVHFQGQRRDADDEDTIVTPIVGARAQCGYEFFGTLF